MSVLEEGSCDEEDGGAARSRESKSATALSILESLAKSAIPPTEAEPAAPPSVEKEAEDDEEAAETSEESDVEQDGVFKLEGLEGVSAIPQTT